MSRKSVLQQRLAKIQAAINATLDRGVQSYSTEIQSLTSLGLDELRRMERDALNELAKVDRGSRFGGIKFTRPS